jgi:hypothetical protein
VADGTGTSLRVAARRGSSKGSSESEAGALDTTQAPVIDVPQSELDAGRRRFTWAALIAIALTAVPFLWILWSLWGPVNPLRLSVYENNFYELQARAMFHGRLSLAPNSLGIEGFVHDGRTYTYFGLFPSIIRMPILLFTSSLDGKLTASYELLAWLLTGLFASLLLWRVRYLVRGDSMMGRTEATAFGVLIASLMGGTTWMLLASTPFVFNEDIAWSICLTVGSLFALLGVIERPSWGRVIVSGVFILCANLDRSTTGWACAVGAGFIALWFLLGFGGHENRRWFFPVLAAGLIPLVVSCAVNYSKFGVFFGVSNQDQVWTHVNAYRRKFLAANHGAEEGTVFTPTNLATYFRPDGLSFSRVFPWVTLPTSPPTALNGVLFDRLYRTASLPASSPLLFLLSIWGLVTAFRPRSVGKVARTRLLLLASGSAGAALMLWGYIAPRYLGDFVPFLVLASAVATADIFRRLEGRSKPVRVGSLAIFALVALFGIAANIGIALVPNEEWDTTQVLNYVQAQKTVSDLTGHPLNANVIRGSSLPKWAPAGKLYVIGNCDGLYISNGEDYSTVPSEQYERNTWMTVELGHAFQHTFRVTVRAPESGQTESVPLLRAGRYTLTMSATPSGYPHLVRLIFMARGPASSYRFARPDVESGSTETITVVTDAAKHTIQVAVNGVDEGTIALPFDAIHVDADAGPSHALSVTNDTASSPQPALCQSLIH